jgi:hypothetical protein
LKARYLLIENDCKIRLIICQKKLAKGKHPSLFSRPIIDEGETFYEIDSRQTLKPQLGTKPLFGMKVSDTFHSAKRQRQQHYQHLKEPVEKCTFVLDKIWPNIRPKRRPHSPKKSCSFQGNLNRNCQKLFFFSNLFSCHLRFRSLKV